MQGLIWASSNHLLCDVVEEEADGPLEGQGISSCDDNIQVYKCLEDSISVLAVYAIEDIQEAFLRSREDGGHHAEVIEEQSTAVLVHCNVACVWIRVQEAMPAHNINQVSRQD